MSEEKNTQKLTLKARMQLVQEEIREHKGSYRVFLVLRALIVLAIIRHAFQGDFESVFSCFIALVLLFVPSIFQARFKLCIPVGLEITILCAACCNIPTGFLLLLLPPGSACSTHDSWMYLLTVDETMSSPAQSPPVVSYGHFGRNTEFLTWSTSPCEFQAPFASLFFHS